MLRKLEYHERFSQADRDALLALPFHIRTYERHHYVVRERDVATHSCLMLSGFAVRSKIAGMGAETGYELPMTQEQLADATGLTAVHVNRTIKGLEADGLIDRANPRAIYIGDWRKLAAAGDFDSGYLHLDRAETQAN